VILAACQRKVMLSEAAGHMTAWRDLRPLTPEEEQLAAQYPEIVRRFAQAIPELGQTKEEENIFRRFTQTQGRMSDLGREVDYIRTILRLYNQARPVFVTDEEKKTCVEDVLPRWRMLRSSGNLEGGRQAWAIAATRTWPRAWRRCVGGTAWRNRLHWSRADRRAACPGKVRPRSERP
jgi:hypothetical protein